MAGVVYNTMIQRFLEFILTAVGHPVQLPPIDISQLVALLGTLLGTHFIDSNYNSPAGTPPSSGKVIDGVWHPNP